MIKPGKAPCALWQKPLADVERRIDESIAAAVENRPPSDPLRVFFRADDIGVPGAAFGRLMDVFTRHQVPLALAVVPAWLTAPRWQAIRKTGVSAPHLWCWHQHGWRHANHQSEGKKQEFGPDRSLDALQADLLRGRQRLEKLMGGDFVPIFTPPWNRCDPRTLELLKRHGYRGVSRSHGAQPSAPQDLTDVQIHIDLHTGKHSNADAAWHDLFNDLDRYLRGPVCGIMIHHQRMNARAFEFLALFIKTLRKQSVIAYSHLHDLTAEHR